MLHLITPNFLLSISKKIKINIIFTLLSLESVIRKSFFKRKYFFSSLNSHQFDKICGFWNFRGSSNVGVGARETRVCASAFCIHLWLWSRRQWRALRTPYVAQSNLCNMCKGILREVFHHHCHNINKTTWFFGKRWKLCMIKKKIIVMERKPEYFTIKDCPNI